MAWYRGARRPLDEAEKSTDAAKARARAMELLAGQELSSGGLYERLNRRFAGQTAAAVVAEMVEREYVNDARYAETRAHGLLAAKKSRRAAAQNLRQKGLSAPQIEQALDTVYAADETEFEAIWQQMKADALALGAEDLQNWYAEAAAAAREAAAPYEYKD